MSGYHHHAVPWCLADPGKGQSRLLGYAFDGFGITSTVTWRGKKVRMYHDVATWEFPYTVGCFRGNVNIHGPAFQ